MSDQQQLPVQQLPVQQFTGYWIPKELNALGLSKTEQMLLAIIDSLTSPAPDFCFASNAYLAKHMNLSESRISFYITKFKRMQLIEEVRFDGRRRRMRTIKSNWYKKAEELEKEKASTLENSKKELCVISPSLTARNHLVCLRENEQHIEKKIEKNKNLSVVDAGAPPPKASQKEEFQEKEQLEKEESTETSPPKVAYVLQNDQKHIKVTESDMYRYLIMSGRNFSSQAILYAWNCLCEYRGVVHNWRRFVEGIAENYEKKEKSREISERKCQNKHKTTATCSSSTSREVCSERDSSEQACQPLVSLGDTLKKLQTSSSTQTTSSSSSDLQAQGKPTCAAPF